jgi:hypothetical protein
MPKSTDPPTPETLPIDPNLSVKEEIALLRSEVELLQSTGKRPNFPRHMATLQALKKMNPRASPERLMDLVERSVSTAEREASLESRKVGVPLFSLFSMGFGYYVVTALHENDYAAATMLGTFTFLCLFLTAFFLGAPRAAIAFFAAKAKATANFDDPAEKNEDA